MGRALVPSGLHGHVLEVGTSVWVPCMVCMGKVDMGLNWVIFVGPIHILYGLSVHGFEMGNNIWAPYRLCMGLVGMG